jgi:hypothetical protein
MPLLLKKERNMENTETIAGRDVLDSKKWLRLILVFTIAQLALSYIIPNNSEHSWRVWVSYAWDAAILYCFFHLMKHNKFYSFAVTCMIIKLVTQVFSQLAVTVFLEDLIQLFHSINPEYDEYSSYSYLSVITTPLSVLGTIAGFLGYLFELWGHSDLAAPFDGKLAKQWKQLFLLNFGAGMLVSALSYLFYFLYNAAVLDLSTYQMVYPLVNLPTIAINILYMLYLWRTIQILVPKEEDLCL